MITATADAIYKRFSIFFFAIIKPVLKNRIQPFIFIFMKQSNTVHRRFINLMKTEMVATTVLLIFQKITTRQQTIYQTK